LETQEKSVSVSCPKCKGTHTVNMLLERPNTMAGKSFVPQSAGQSSRQLGAILRCPKTHRNFHTSIVLRVEDNWDIKGIKNVD